MSDASLVCGSCGAPLRAGMKFCSSCGKPAAPARPVATGLLCVRCGNPLKPGARFCNKCGATVVAAALAATCSECGNPLKPGARFCNKCGATVAAERRSQPPQSADAAPAVDLRRCQSCGRAAEPDETHCASCQAELPRRKGPFGRRTFAADIGSPEPVAVPTPRAKPAPSGKPAARGISSTARDIDFGDEANAAPLAISDLDPLRTSAETPTRLRGRDAELAALQAQLDSALQGSSGLALILGERGLGKTRLLGELVALARARGFLVAEARGGRFGVPVALDLFRQWLVSVCDQFAAGAYGAEQRHRASVGTALGWTHVPALPEVLRRRLEQLFDGIEFEPAARPEELQQRMLAALVRALWRFAQNRPLCLLVDDADAADPLSCELMFQLCERVPDCRLLLVAAGAPALAAQSPAVKPLLLGPLSESDARALAQDFLEQAALPPELGALLTERAAGNPRLITAQMRELLDQQLLVQRAGSWSLAPIDASQLLAQPQDLTARQAARVEQRRLPGLQLIATFGQRVLRAHFDAAVAAVGGGAERALEAAVGAGLLAACERSPNLFEFGQQGSRSDLLVEIDDETRQIRHLDVVKGYRDAPVFGAALSAELVARHQLLAGASAETQQQAAGLARALSQRGLFTAAGEPLKSALAIALEALRQPAGVTPSAVATVFELAAELVALLTARDPAQAIMLTPKLLEQLRGHFALATAVPLLRCHARALAAADRLADAISVSGRAVAAWPANGDALTGAVLALERALLLEQGDSLAEAAEAGQRVVSTLDQCAASDQPERALACHYRGELHLLLGRCCSGLQQRELAQRWATRGRQLAQGDGLALIEVQAMLLLASLAAADADPAPANALLQEAQGLAENDSDPWSMAQVHLAHGQAVLAQARARRTELAARSGLSLTTMQRLQQPTPAPAAPDQPPRHRCRRAPGTAARADGEVPYEGMSFDAVLLAEQTVLNEQLKKELLYCDAHLGGWCYFELLGIPCNASTDDVRKAYFAASKRFHPDRYFRKNTGSYGERIGRVFEAIKSAYNVLSNEETRAAYEATIDWPLPPGLIEELAANHELQQQGIDLLRAAMACGRLSRRASILAEARSALAEAGVPER